MNIESTMQSDVCVAAVTGRLDTLTAPQFDTWFAARLQAGETRLVLDLAGLEYVSSAGLRSLLVLAKRIKAAAGAVALCGLTGIVAEVFALAGFMEIFKVAATLEEAVNAVR